MPKYSHDELWKCEELPIDCNSEAEAYAKEFCSPELMAAMKMMRERKVSSGYGKITHMSQQGVPEVVFKFQRGICEHASPLIWLGTKTVIQGSYQFYKPYQRD
jgi:hypothetical protein